jgi:hypothetical protein
LGREVGNVCAPGQEAEQHERVVIQIGRSGAWLRPTGPTRDIGAEHVVRGRDPLIPDLLGRLGKFPQGRRLTADIDNRKSYAEFHLHLHSVVFCAPA